MQADIQREGCLFLRHKGTKWAGWALGQRKIFGQVALCLLPIFINSQPTEKSNPLSYLVPYRGIKHVDFILQSSHSLSASSPPHCHRWLDKCSEDRSSILCCHHGDLIPLHEYWKLGSQRHTQGGGLWSPTGGALIKAVSEEGMAICLNNLQSSGSARKSHKYHPHEHSTLF